MALLLLHGGNVADFLTGFLGLQIAAHDFTGTRFGQLGYELQSRRGGDGTQLTTYVLDQCGRERIAGHMPGAEKDKDLDALALQCIGDADGRSLANGGMRDQGGFNFGGTDTMAGNVEHIVGASQDRDVSLFVLEGNDRR